MYQSADSDCAAPTSAFAGIWRPSTEGNAFAFLTCEPNPLVAPIHPKAMPVILHPQDYDLWLTGNNVLDLAAPFPSQLMSIIQSQIDQ
jgi:putative SOS response-associated peptidase YedK